MDARSADRVVDGSELIVRRAGIYTREFLVDQLADSTDISGVYGLRIAYVGAL